MEILGITLADDMSRYILKIISTHFFSNYSRKTKLPQTQELLLYKSFGGSFILCGGGGGDSPYCF